MDLNKISLKQQGGDAMIPNEPGMRNEPKVDPAIQQITEFFAQAIESGQRPEDVVISLMDKQVDQETIIQVLTGIGYEQNDLEVLFQNIQERTNPAPPTDQQINQNPEQLARQQKIQEGQEGLNVNIDPIEMAKSGIEIKPENRGKFTKWAKARGMTVKEAYAKVLKNKDRYPASVVKMANFARNAAGWKKGQEGIEIPSEALPVQDPSALQRMQIKLRDLIKGNERGEASSITPETLFYGTEAMGGIPEGYVVNPFQTMEFRDVNQNGIEDREEGLYIKRDLIREEDLPKSRGLKKGGEFKPHLMYDPKTGKAYEAKVPADHERMAKMGYLHKDEMQGGKAQMGFEMSDLADFLKSVEGDDLSQYKQNYQNSFMAEGYKPSQEEFDRMDQSTKEMYAKFFPGHYKISADTPTALDLYKLRYQNSFMMPTQTDGPQYKYGGPKGEEAYLARRDAAIKASMDKAYTGKELNDAIQKYAKRDNIYITGKEGNVIYDGRSNESPAANGVVTNPFYVNPLIFSSGKSFQPGRLVNDIADLYMGVIGTEDSPGIIGYGGAEANYLQNQKDKYENATFEYKADDSPENIEAIKAYMKQYALENPNVEDAIANLPNIKTSERKVDKALNSFTDWFKNAGQNVKQGGQETYDAIIDMIQGTKGTSTKTPGIIPDGQFGNGEFGDFDVMTEDNPYGLPNWMFDSNVDPGQTNYMEDTRIVADAQLAKKFPGLGDTPLEEEQNKQRENQQKDAQLTADELFKKIEPGTMDIDTNEGFFEKAERFGNSTAVRLADQLADSTVKIVSNITDFQADEAVDDARVDFYNTRGADFVAPVVTDALFKRGKGPDINSGIFGSEGDATTGLYITKKGGEPSNAGFQALPDYVQDKIMKRQNGGEEIYNNPFGDLRSFTDDLNQYQDGNGEMTRDELMSQIMDLRSQVEQEDSRIQNFQSNIDKLYRGFLTSKEVDDEELRKAQLAEILGADSSINPALFNTVEGDYGRVVGLDSIPAATLNWGSKLYDSGEGYGCTSYGCGILRQAGATTAEGKPFPIISGNSQLNGMIERNQGGLGMQLMEPGFTDLLPGDRVVSNYSTSGGSGAAHTMIFTGDYDENGSPIMMENSGGNWKTGVDYRPLSEIKRNLDLSDPDSGLRVTRYVGQAPELRTKLRDLQKELDSRNVADIPIKSRPIAQLSTLPMGVDNLKVMQPPTFQKSGGETINVDATMLAKLIAAGADIEML